MQDDMRNRQEPVLKKNIKRTGGNNYLYVFIFVVVKEHCIITSIFLYFGYIIL